MFNYWFGCWKAESQTLKTVEKAPFLRPSQGSAARLRSRLFLFPPFYHHRLCPFKGGTRQGGRGLTVSPQQRLGAAAPFLSCSRCSAPGCRDCRSPRPSANRITGLSAPNTQGWPRRLPSGQVSQRWWHSLSIINHLKYLKSSAAMTTQVINRVAFNRPFK